MGCSDVAGIYQWETADLLIKLDGDGIFANTTDIVVSIVQGAARTDYHKADLVLDEDAGTIEIHMSQEDAGKYMAAKATVQVNILYATGERDVSETGCIEILGNLYGQVME